MTNDVYDYDDLVRFGADVLTSLGVPADDATLVSDSLVVAERWGHPSHGMLRLPWYVERIRNGVVKPVTELTILEDRGALVSADGNSGVGQIVTEKVMQLAMERAAQHGIGAVGVRNSNHFGTAAYFTRRAAEAGFATILTTNGSPAMAPWGGMDKVIGANPWSFATPDGFGSVAEVDIANTGVARGKIYAAAEKGVEIPNGWALDKNGNPTTDAQAALDDGIVLPMAGHKGYAISFMMDVFSGVLTGSQFGRGVNGPWQPDKVSGAGHLAIAIDIRAFQPLERFDERMQDLIGQVRSSRTVPGVDQIYYPGEIENDNVAAERPIVLPDTTVEHLRTLAETTGTTLPAAR